MERKPPWLKVRLGGGPNYQMVKGLVERYHLHTVCQSPDLCRDCPNLGALRGTKISSRAFKRVAPVLAPAMVAHGGLAPCLLPEARSE